MGTGRRVGRRGWMAVAATAALVGSGGSVPVAAQGVKARPAAEYMMDRADEIQMARSAGPEMVSADATVLVMRGDGAYETAVEGTNGWVCFVGRGWTAPAEVRDGRRVLTGTHFDPKQKAPQCFNPPAVESVVAWHRMTSRMFMQGMDSEQVEDRVQEALRSGELPLPAAGAMSYMMSPHQHLNDVVGAWNPHFMFYTPYADGEDLFGTNRINTTTPFVTDVGGPFAVTTMVASKFSDGTPAPHTLGNG